jgi:hypothetical protein
VAKDVMAPVAVSCTRANGVPVKLGPPAATGIQLLHVPPGPFCQAVYRCPSAAMPNTVIAPLPAATTVGELTSPLPLLIWTNGTQLLPAPVCQLV